MGKLKVSVRLGIGFGVVLVLLAVLATIGVLRMHDVDRDLDRITEDLFPKTVQSNQIILNLDTIAIALRGTLIFFDEDALDRIDRQAAAAHQTITENLEHLQKSITSEAGIERLKAIQDVRLQYNALLTRFNALIKKNYTAYRHKLRISRVISERTSLNICI